MSLPETYQEVEYIESTGTQYIDTGIANILNIEVEMVAQQTKKNHGYITMLGANTIAEFKVIFAYNTEYIFYSQPTSNYIMSNKSVDGQKHILKFISTNNYYKLIIDDYSYTNYSRVTTDTTRNIYVFARNNDDSNVNNYSNQKLFSLSIKQDNTLIRDFVPCYRKSDSEIGLYDLINNTFYTNSGTGKFLKGPSLTPIDNKLEYLNETKELIKQAIIDKGQTITSQDTFRSYASKIAEIETGILSEQDVNFYDYDGELLYSYNKTDFLALTAMPENPTHQGLTAQGWNWTLANAKTYVTNYNKLNIGQMYATNDGKTRIYIDLSDKNALSPYLGLGIYGSVTVDWGDNTTSTITGSNVNTLVNTQHTYSAPDTYMITLTPDANTIIKLLGDTSYFSRLIGYDNDTKMHQVYKSAIIKIELGTGIDISNIYCFGRCYNLETITIPNTIAGTLGAGTFANCNALKYVTIPTSITEIGASSFAYCRSLAHIALPKELTAFAASNNVFVYCSSLKNVTLPDSLTDIGNYTFDACGSLEYVILPDSITTYGTYTFRDCHNLKHVTLPNSGLTGLANYTFYACLSLESVDLSNATTLTFIGQSAFYDCYTLKSLNLPSTITTFYNNAFVDCQRLTHLVIPASLTTIGTYVFNNCTSMRYYDFSNCTAVPSLANTNAFMNMPTDCKIIVPNDLYDTWIAANNWSTYASYIIKKSDWDNL